MGIDLCCFAMPMRGPAIDHAVGSRDWLGGYHRENYGIRYSVRPKVKCCSCRLGRDYGNEKSAEISYERPIQVWVGIDLLLIATKNSRPQREP